MSIFNLIINLRPIFVNMQDIMLKIIPTGLFLQSIHGLKKNFYKSCNPFCYMHFDWLIFIADWFVDIIDDHRQLVEPACGASLAAVYSGILNDLQAQGQLGPIKSALIVVCGGSSVTLEALDKWKKEFQL